MKFKKPIIVTGSHRSGTTWVGKVLTLSPKVRYVHEPFNIDEARINPLNYWFEYVGENSPKEQQEKIYTYILELLNFNGPGLLKEFSVIKGPRDVLNFVRDSYERINKRPLLKDPIAIMSIDWLVDKFGADVVALIRHPAAFVASLKVKKWDHVFEHFIAQPQLMKILDPYADKIYAYDENPPDIIDQGILLWNIIYYRVRQYQLKYPDWNYITHEDLSRNPIDGYKDLYKKLNLRFSPKIRAEILKTTSASKSGRLVRDSKKNIATWKKRLKPGEIERIRKETQEISDIYYTDSDW